MEAIALLILIFIGLIPAVIAGHKGHSFGKWWIYGSLLFIIALPHALLIKLDQVSIEKKQMTKGMKKCPFCGEMAKGDINPQRPYLIRDCCAKKYFSVRKIVEPKTKN